MCSERGRGRRAAEGNLPLGRCSLRSFALADVVNGNGVEIGTAFPLEFGQDPDVQYHGKHRKSGPNLYWYLVKSPVHITTRNTERRGAQSSLVDI